MLEIPVGLGLITLVLFSLAGINLLTKTTATISGAAFTIIFFTAFSFSEKRYAPKEPRKPKLGEADREISSPGSWESLSRILAGAIWQCTRWHPRPKPLKRPAKGLGRNRSDETRYRCVIR